MMLFNEGYELNVLVSIVSTLSPIVTVSNPEHDRNASLPIDMTELGIMMFSNEENDASALSPIEVVFEITNVATFEF